MKKYIALLLYFSWLGSARTNAQNCTANLGNPLINSTFSAGPGFGQPLAPGITSLSYVALSCPTDGQYTIVSSIPGCAGNGWQAIPGDHTGDYNGYFMLANGSSSDNDLFVQTVGGFCQGTTYQFSAWMLNPTATGGTAPPNIRFNIENTDGTVLQSNTTGALPVTAPALWTKYAFYFTIPQGLSSALLRITMLAAAGTGNDLAIDDISFRAAGPTVDLRASAFPGNAGFVCTGNTVSFSSDVTNCYLSTAYQWQRSVDNGITWSDIPGATANGYNTTFTTAGTFLYRLKVAESGNIASNYCSVYSNPITVVAEDGPATALSIAPSANSVCAGTSVTFTANPTGGGPSPFFQWQVNGNAVSAGLNGAYTTSQLKDGDVVTCVMTSSAPCAHPGTIQSNAVTMSVIIPPTPSVSVTPATVNVCAGSTITFTATAANGGTAPQYQWLVNGANVGAGGATYTSSQLNDGDLITCTLMSNAVCAAPATATSNTVTIRITPLQPPAVSISASARLICAGDQVFFTASPTNGGSAPQYQWLVNGIPVGNGSTGAGGSTYIASRLNDGDIVSCILTSNATCVSPVTATSNTIRINVQATIAPSVTIAPSTNPVCSGSSVTFTANGTNGGPAPQYQWLVNGTPAGNGSTGAGGSTYTTSTLANGDIITCILTSNATCAAPATATSNAITMTVTRTSIPSVSITASATTICTGTPVTFTANAANGGPAPQYLWLVNAAPAGNGSTGAGGSTYTTSTLANGDIITCILTGNAACASPATATSNALPVTVNPILVPSISIAPSGNSICPATPVIFTATLTNCGDAPVCQWQVNGKDVGAGGIYYSSNSFVNGDKIICICLSNAACAAPATTASNTVTMAVKPPTPPAITILSPAGTVCSGTPLTFNAATVNGGSAPQYQWQVNGINAGSNNNTFTTSALADHDIVTCILTSNSTCANPATVTSNTVTTSVSSWSVPAVTLSAPATTICSGQPETFTATPVNGGATPSYDWLVNDVRIGTGGATYTSSSLNNGDRVSCTLISNAACVTPTTASSNTVTMAVIPSPVPSIVISASRNPICAGTPVTFDAIATNGGDAPVYQWQINGAGAGSGAVTYTSNTLSDGDRITCILTSSAICANPATVGAQPVTMTVHPLPVIPPGQIFYMYGGQPVQLNPTIDGNIAGFLWSPAAGLSADNIRNPVASPPSATLYTLDVATFDGCTTSSTIKVEPAQKLGIPNAFTPNGDGNNDVFYIIGGLPGTVIREFAVFNRWGQQVFRVHDATPGDRRFGWNGNLGGAPAPAGTYVYSVILGLPDNTQQKFSGTVILIR
jgi:gliding motility-associated-like protein